MTKRCDQVKKRLSISREFVNPSYSDSTRKIEKFLNELMQRHNPIIENPTNEDAIAQLELINKYARKISNSAELYASIKDAGLSDCAVTFEEISNHKRKMMIELYNHSKSMVEILDNDHFLLLNPVIGEITAICQKQENSICKTTIPSLSNKLKKLVKIINETLPAEIETEPKIKGRGPIRLQLIKCIADVWSEITGKPVGKRNIDRETGKPSGEFFDFLRLCLQLVAPSINPDEAHKKILEIQHGEIGVE